MGLKLLLLVAIYFYPQPAAAQQRSSQQPTTTGNQQPLLSPAPAPAPAPAQRLLFQFRNTMNSVMSSVHPVDGPMAIEAVGNGPQRGMRKRFGEIGTWSALICSLLRSVFAVSALIVMVTIHDFSTITSFRYFSVVMGLNILWSFPLVVVNSYALLVKCTLREHLFLFAIGDTITCVLTYTAAFAAGGITFFFEFDINDCSHNPCPPMTVAPAMALACFLATIPSFHHNFRAIVNM